MNIKRLALLTVAATTLATAAFADGGKGPGGFLKSADLNKDGRVSLKEATDSAARHFDMADTNHDGRITPDERKQMRMQFMEKHRAPKAS